MNIGFVSTWFERGAAYVTKAYIDILNKKNNVFVFARGGEMYAEKGSDWDQDYVTWGSRLQGTDIKWSEFEKWITKNKLDIVFFNEQRDIEIILKIKMFLPHIKVGSYIDYYTQDTVENFEYYDFLICNTKRHFEVFKNVTNCYYIQWGTDIEKFKYEKKDIGKEIVFFHSCGMSNRKGTDLLIKTYIEYGLYKKSKLIIHTQKNLKDLIKIDEDDLKGYNIEVINKTVQAPGLYHMGDVYVYPTYLEGLGLTQFEALASGLPIIVPNCQPMSEIVNSEVGMLVDIYRYKCRSDAYYWPLSIVDRSDLAEKMNYYINNRNNINEIKGKCRDYAVKNLNWKDREWEVNDIFEKAQIKLWDKNILKGKLYLIKRRNKSKFFNATLKLLPECITQGYYSIITHNK